MDNRSEMLQLCRLCLVKDDVNIPIFEEQGDIRKIFLKISSCLPVKVSREDKLPKKICDGCSYKLDMLYEFWNTTANAEKQLLSWLGEAGMNSKMTDDTISAVAQQIKPTETFVKQEAIDPSDIHTEVNDDDKSYMFQQKFTVEEAGPSATVTSNEEEPPPKRARRTAAVKAQIAMDPESDDDDDSGEPMTKMEDESEDSDGEDREPTFVDVPSTSADDQPGPSGVGKDGVEAPVDTLKLEEDMITCGETWKNYPQLLEHSGIHKDLQKIYKDEEYFREPIKIYDPDKKIYTIQCSICSKPYLKEAELRAHMNRMHKSAHVCDICGKTISSQDSLKNHLRTHTGEKPFDCKFCEKKFSSKPILRSHIRVHTKEKPFSCQICNKSFTQRGTLTLHMRLHSGEKPFNCLICSKNFVSKTVLKNHKCYANIVK